MPLKPITENALLTFLVQPYKEDALPVHRQKKKTTSTASSSTQEQIAPGLWPRLSPET